MPFCVQVEFYFDLRHAPRRWRDAFKVELAQESVVGAHFALALKDADGNRRLVVVGGAENLLPLGGNRRVASRPA